FLDCCRCLLHIFRLVFFFVINHPPTTYIYTLSLHDALPISRDYLAAAFPELNAWERAGADASSAGMVDAGFENQKELTKMQQHADRKSGSAGMPRPISYAVFCLKKKKKIQKHSITQMIHTNR